jgi:hypothetical protein
MLPEPKPIVHTDHVLPSPATDSQGSPFGTDLRNIPSVQPEPAAEHLLPPLTSKTSPQPNSSLGLSGINAYPTPEPTTVRLPTQLDTVQDCHQEQPGQPSSTEKSANVSPSARTTSLGSDSDDIVEPGTRTARHPTVGHVVTERQREKMPAHVVASLPSPAPRRASTSDSRRSSYDTASESFFDAEDSGFVDEDVAAITETLCKSPDPFRPSESGPAWAVPDLDDPLVTNRTPATSGVNTPIPSRPATPDEDGSVRHADTDSICTTADSKSEEKDNTDDDHDDSDNHEGSAGSHAELAPHAELDRSEVSPIPAVAGVSSVGTEAFMAAATASSDSGSSATITPRNFRPGKRTGTQSSTFSVRSDVPAPAATSSAYIPAPAASLSAFPQTMPPPSRGSVRIRHKDRAGSLSTVPETAPPPPISATQHCYEFAAIHPPGKAPPSREDHSRYSVHSDMGTSRPRRHGEPSTADWEALEYPPDDMSSAEDVEDVFSPEVAATIANGVAGPSMTRRPVVGSRAPPPTPASSFDQDQSMLNILSHLGRAGVDSSRGQEMLRDFSFTPAAGVPATEILVESRIGGQQDLAQVDEQLDPVGGQQAPDNAVLPTQAIGTFLFFENAMGEFIYGPLEDSQPTSDIEDSGTAPDPVAEVTTRVEMLFAAADTPSSPKASPRMKGMMHAVRRSSTRMARTVFGSSSKKGGVEHAKGAST